MKLFLLRHAHAKDSFPDEERQLSERGVAQLDRLAQSLSKELFSSVAQVWHSPYCRARETAEIFSAKMAMSAPLVNSVSITPSGDSASLAKQIAKLSCFDADLMIVSHNPFLELLASELLEPRNGYVHFRKATLACLNLVEYPSDVKPLGEWALDFLISASVLEK